MIERISYCLGLVTLVLFLFTPPDAQSALDNSSTSLQVQFYSPADDNPFLLLIVEKRHQRLSLFKQGETLERIQTYTCATGENPGIKIASGDARTPEGIYFITEIYEDKKITVFGSRAFHLDYPNIFDNHAGRMGDGIFIHGTNKKLVPYSTNGCITLDNADLDILAEYLTVSTLPVIVLDSLEETNIDTQSALELNDDSFQSIQKTMGIYPGEVDAKQIRSLYFLKTGAQAVASISYDEYDGGSLQYRYHKRVYLTPGISKDWRILHSVHSQEVIPSIHARRAVKRPLLAVVDTPSPSPASPSPSSLPPASPPPVQTISETGDELLAFVEKWRHAWETKDIDTYMECYAPGFTSGKLDRTGWRKKKSYLNARYRFIKVSIRNIVVKWTKTGANVSFYQKYESDKYKSTGTKILELVKVNDTWMIEKELM